MTWKRPEVEHLLLPSGNEADCKKPDIMGLLVHNEGIIPDFLTGQLAGRLTGKSNEPTTQGTETTGSSASANNPLSDPKLGAFMNMIVSAALVNPRIVTENPDYDSEQARILIEDVLFEDKLVIFNWAMPAEEFAAVMSFRKNSGNSRHLQPVRNGKSVRRKTVRDVRTQQPVD